MTKVCGVNGCTHRSARGKVRYFKLPKISNLPSQTVITTKRQNAWLQALHLTGQKTKYIFVCSIHFITGKYI